VHDIADLEARGLPGVFVASTEFVEAAAAQAEALGFDPARVFVAHPIQDRTDDEVRALADGAVDEILAALRT
jgi:alkanesulfonate monooxygenase SsuD/methylene tetrahydromethanopterin reductase-like flavin-dependent oxidoreductase (luciferase family)